MSFPRSSGLLLHPTSLPGPFGIGDLGDEAYRFADFLEQSGQSLWQILPLGPTGYGDSPYACYSAFAGNTLLISSERLVKENLLTEDDLANPPDFDDARINFHEVHLFKEALLATAYRRFKESRDSASPSFKLFCAKEQEWLDDYAFFRALKDQHGGKSWNEWEAPLVRRDPAALASAT